MTRRTKTPTQRAEEALGLAERLVDRLTRKRDALVAEAAELEPLIRAATTRRDYAAANPDLPQPTLTGETAPEPR